jgi:tRNA pseudouridine38-40 synthase
MKNIKLVIAFKGAGYHGWQIQQNARTVQGTLGEAIKTVTGEITSVTGSGRTDSGAHARGLVANFQTATRIPPRRLLHALNSVLPHEIRVLSAKRVRAEFHARYDARSKVYRYQVYRGTVLLPHLACDHYHYPYKVDLQQMSKAMKLVQGEHDFASFAARSGRLGKGDDPETRDTVRHIFRSTMRKSGLRLLFTFEGSGFLHHMARNLVGTVLEVGRGRLGLQEFSDLFGKRDRTLAGGTAPAHGLILMKVRYHSTQTQRTADDGDR